MATLSPLRGLSGLRLPKGATLTVVDPCGEQVSDLFLFAAEDHDEWFSSGRTTDYANTIYLTTGHTLYSNRSRPMWTIVEDTVGRHDFLLTPCSPETFSSLYGTTGHHPSCFENLSRAFAPYGISPDAIPTTAMKTFSPTEFMNHTVEDGMRPNVGRTDRSHPKNRPEISAPPEVDKVSGTLPTL